MKKNMILWSTLMTTLAYSGEASQESPSNALTLFNQQVVFTEEQGISNQTPQKIITTLAEIQDKNNKVQKISFPQFSISGPIPDSLGNFSELKDLDLSGNQLTGPIPDGLYNCTRLIKLNLSGNQLTGGISEKISKLSSLRALILSHNQLTGGLPIQFRGMINLGLLNLSHNQFNGAINSVVLVGYIEDINLSHNRFTGKILESNPITFGLHMIKKLDLSHNHFSGNVNTLSDMKGLRTLNISHNHFNGSFDKIGAEHKNLTELSLSHNNFKKHFIRNCLLSELNTLDLSNNPFGEWNLREWKNTDKPFKNLKHLDLSYTNMVYDFVSDEGFSHFRNIPNLKFFDISGNPKLQSHHPVPQDAFPASLTFLNMTNSEQFNARIDLLGHHKNLIFFSDFDINRTDNGVEQKIELTRTIQENQNFGEVIESLKKLKNSLAENTHPHIDVQLPGLTLNLSTISFN